MFKKKNDLLKPRICIVGSGPGGAIAAIELAKSGNINVILVDIDSIKQSSLFSESKNLDFENIGHSFNQEVTRAFGFGGSSNLWHGVITKLDEEDWQIFDEAAGEKISLEIKSIYSKLNKYFGEIRYIRSQHSIRHQFSKSLLYKELETAKLFCSKDFYIQIKPLRLRAKLAKMKNCFINIEFVENATALYLQGSKVPSRADGLVINVNGTNQTILADYFILAAGALETPRLVLQGNQSGNFLVQSSHVGKNLFDHPWTVVGEIVSNKRPFRLGLSDIYAGPGLRYRVGYRLMQSVKIPTLGSNHCISFKPLLIGNYALFKEAMKAIIIAGPRVNQLLALFYRFKIQDIFSSLFLLIIEKLGIGVFVKKALVFCYLEQPIRRDSSVHLTDKLDNKGRRIPAINWVVGIEEMEAIFQIKKNLLQSFSKSNHFSFFPYEIQDGSLSSSSHHAGTMRIGTNSLNGVVDKDLKIFGTQNVFVCDLSVFPNYGNSNPTFTLAALSLRLSKHIKSKLSLGNFDQNIH